MTDDSEEVPSANTETLGV